MGLRKNLLTQSPPRPPWARRTFRRCAKCRNVGKGKSWYLSEDFTTLAPLDLPPPKQGCCSAGGGLVAYAKALCQMSKCGAGEEGIFCRERFDIMQNVEMCELEKEMDKDGIVVFRVGWTIR